ncbi:hypothetical protein REB14_22085 [Chryseobacterium sp. ES2]|uniref:Potassium channel domain-containing protein n=1 Tax=Chryseobacterium metallicongregator TaxID=3073042 RepID=A0ABU1EAQ9_9FLAO|nr:hypothetical protein [Chryseobacterium sp. ES2]MDR4954882.1 hypothetical protein [Chryseobacterium sp. ES2]
MSIKSTFRKITPSILNLVLPLFMYLVYKTLQKPDDFTFYSFLFFFYFFLIMAIMNIIIDFVTKIHNINQSKPKYYIILEVIKFIVLSSFLFSTYYWIIHDYNNKNFLNVITGNNFEIFLDFYFYSITSFIMNNSSEIKPNTLLAKGFVLTQIIASFSTIVLFLAQYKEFGNIFKQIEDKINNK